MKEKNNKYVTARAKFALPKQLSAKKLFSKILGLDTCKAQFATHILGVRNISFTKYISGGFYRYSITDDIYNEYKLIYNDAINGGVKKGRSLSVCLTTFVEGEVFNELLNNHIKQLINDNKAA